MNILSISTQKPHSTGSGTYLTEVVRSLARQGHHQAVVSGVYRSDSVHFPDNVSFYPVYYTEPGENYHAGDLPFPIVGMSDIMPYPSLRYSEMTSDSTDQLKTHFVSATSRAIQQLRPDIILCHHLFLLTSILREAFPHTRMYGLCHGSDLRQMQNLGEHHDGYADTPISEDKIRRGISSLDHIFALHEAQKQRIHLLYDVPYSRISVIGTGYNSDIFYCDQADADSIPDQTRPYRFIYAGKICREKGMAELLSALDQLACEEESAKRPFELLLAGGCNDPDIRKMLTGREEPLTPGSLTTHPYRIQYLGMLSQNELADAFRSADTFVLPSYYEGLPLVLLEAMACGLRTVCNDLPGVREWLDRVIPENRTAFIRMPELKSADQPKESAIPDYIHRLKDVLRSELIRGRNSKNTPPDTSGASWDAVARRIIFTE